MQLANKIGVENLRGDLFDGLTAAIVALPLALAFGVASGAGAIALFLNLVLLHSGMIPQRRRFDAVSRGAIASCLNNQTQKLIVAIALYTALQLNLN